MKRLILFGFLVLAARPAESAEGTAKPATQADLVLGGYVESTSAGTWKFLQQANVGYRTGGGLFLEGGIFLSPIEPEGMAVKDQWNSVVDNNDDKSVAAELTYAVADKVTAHVLYFGGVERPEGAPEGSPWRHLFDAYVTWLPTSDLSVNLHGDAGSEDNGFGTSSWSAGALSARWRAADKLYLSARADLFHEVVASDTQGTASAIFWPSSWVASETVTADVRSADNVSLRLEYRPDEAKAPMFFEEEVATDGNGAFLPNARTQNTVTAGMIVWF